MKRAILWVVVLDAASCAHQEKPYTFGVQAPPAAVLPSVQASMPSPAMVASPSKVVTPWEYVGHELGSTDVYSGPTERITDWRRLAVVLVPTPTGTKVIVKQEFATCPANLTPDRSPTYQASCVITPEVLRGDQNRINQLGRALQARLATAPVR